MNLAQLRAFDAVARSGSFTAAAERLHVTQPAITSHVRALESYYEVDLFRRRGRGVQPTELGEQLAIISHRLFALESDAVDLLRATKALERGSLRIAADGPYFVVPLVAAFRARFPGVRISLSIDNSSRILEELMEERCDISVLPATVPDERLHTVTLAHHRIVVFVSSRHEWALEGRQRISIKELDGRPVILREQGSSTRRSFEQACMAAGIQPHFTLETTSRETVKESVAAGLGIGVIAAPEMRPDPRLWPLHVEDADLACVEQVMCLERRLNLRVLQEFLRLVEVVRPQWDQVVPPWEAAWSADA